MSTHQNRSDEGLLLATFLLGDAVFGVDAHQVQEVVRPGRVTSVRHAPPDVIGIRNLRGRIVTVLDLRVRLGLGQVASSAENRILIVDLQAEPLGLLVDSIADTLATSLDQLVPAPPNLHGLQSQNLLGVCRGSGRLVAVLNLAKVLEFQTVAA